MDASSTNKSAGENSAEDSAVTLLLHLNEERGKMFNESDYAEMRASILDELSHGARLRPFTWFTFGIIILGLVGTIALGIVTARSNEVRDHLLTIVSTLALMAILGFVGNLIRGLRSEAERSLDTRLAELEELQQRELISPDEYQDIRANILISRQRAGAKQLH